MKGFERITILLSFSITTRVSELGFYSLVSVVMRFNLGSLDLYVGYVELPCHTSVSHV